MQSMNNAPSARQRPHLDLGSWIFSGCWMLALGCSFLLAPAAFAQSAAWVTTDAPDYPPGGTVYITGAGFAPGEIVTNQVLHIPDTGDNNTSPAHQPWTVTADDAGNFSTTWNVPFDQDELGATLQLTATGQTSGLTAQTTFTDAGPAADGDGTMTVSPTSVTAGSTGNTLTFTFTGPNAKTFNTSSSVTVLVPADWTAPQTTASGNPGFVSAVKNPSGSGGSVGTVTVSGN